MQSPSAVIEYRQHLRWKRLVLAFSIVLLPISFCIAISFGVIRIPIGDVFTAMFSGVWTDSTVENTGVRVILYSRLPQAVLAVLAGAGLSITGMAMQAVLRNPLSSPFTLGISSAAAFGAACVVVFGGGTIALLDRVISMTGFPYGMIAIGAFVSALLATGLILLLAGHKHIRTETIILTGVALNAFYGAGMMLLQYIAEEQQLAAIVYWTFGDTQRGTWSVIQVLVILVPLAAIWFCFQGWNYNALSLGEETARGLGVSVRRVRGLTMLIGSLLTSVLVASLGVIGFIGLVVPHLSRLLIGSDHRYALPLSFFLGGILLLISDTAARLVVLPRVMPVSILTALIGAPIFLFMLLRKGGSSC